MVIITLNPDLKHAAASNDTAPPTSFLDGCSFAEVPAGLSPGRKVIRCVGRAVDSGGGVVAAVEVSTNGGINWHPALIPALIQETNVSYTAEVLEEEVGRINVECRAVDDTGNLEVPHS